MLGLELQFMKFCVDTVAEVDAEDDEDDKEGKDEHVADRMVLFLVLNRFYLGAAD